MKQILMKEFLLYGLLVLYLATQAVAQEAATLSGSKTRAVKADALQPVKAASPAVAPVKAETLKLKPAVAPVKPAKGGVKPVKAVAPVTSLDGFKITGIAKGIADSTWILLESAGNSTVNKVMDSTMVINEKFELTGKVEEPPMRALLRTKNFSDYRFIWLENRQILFNGSKGRFREAEVSGSETEQKSSELDALILPIRKSLDSLQARLQDKGLVAADSAELVQQMQQLEEEAKQQYISFVRQNPNAVVSAYILETYKSTWGKKTTKDLFANLSEENRNSPYGAAIKDFLDLNKNPRVGDKFADFSQSTLDGKEVKLSDYKGKVVLLEFWASNCGPCRVENPNLVKTYEHYKSKGFEVLGVSLDVNRDSWEKAVDKDGLTWVNVSELNGMNNTAALIYGINAIPDNFLIDRQGTIIGRNLRGAKLNEHLAQLLK